MRPFTIGDEVRDKIFGEPMTFVAFHSFEPKPFAASDRFGVVRHYDECELELLPDPSPRSVEVTGSVLAGAVLPTC